MSSYSQPRSPDDEREISSTEEAESRKMEGPVDERIKTWTVPETLALLSAKMQYDHEVGEESCFRKKGVGFCAMWERIEQICSLNSVQRTSDQCYRRWKRIISSYHKIKNWERGTGTTLYWSQERRITGASFNKSVWDAMNTYLSEYSSLKSVLDTDAGDRNHTARPVDVYCPPAVDHTDSPPLADELSAPQLIRLEDAMECLQHGQKKRKREDQETNTNSLIAISTSADYESNEMSTEKAARDWMLEDEVDSYINEAVAADHTDWDLEEWLNGVYDGASSEDGNKATTRLDGRQSVGAFWNEVAVPLTS